MKPSLQKFGDSSWTQDKLERVRKYLAAYTKIMRSRPHKFAYIDAFAGTGYHELNRKGSATLFDAEDQADVDAYLDGSARKALQVEPPFNKYIFIEKSRRKASELQKLKADFPDADIEIKNEDANTCLQELCRKQWTKKRAVLFVDPFGMQLTWDTLEAVAKTQAIDTWILFPVSAVNRLLMSSGKMPATWSRRLDLLFGEQDWRVVFFPTDRTGGCAEQGAGQHEVDWPILQSSSQEHLRRGRAQSLHTSKQPRAAVPTVFRRGESLRGEDSGKDRPRYTWA